jgi:anhydro-N-acetylmuramic acid kinase
MMKQYEVIGVMSGTSLDGVDLAHCVFTKQNDAWNYQITKATTIPYDHKWIRRLSQLHRQPAFVFPKTDAFYGKYLGILIRDFIKQNHLTVDFIASHGHTIFHQPQHGFTAQIGNGANIYAETGIKVVNDFRVVDVALNGQGAPLVPIGDELLFSDVEACLNLGGFSNISFNQNNKRVAFDISVCNIVLNKVAKQLGAEYDEGGQIAASGEVNEDLLNRLNALPYYQITHAKSLGIEWVEQEFWPCLSDVQLSVEDVMATLTHHIAYQIALVIKHNNLTRVLTTGGGAFNATLIDWVEKLCGVKLLLPAAEIINYKEALVFAFLGVLRLENEINSLSSVTGARKNSIGGCIWG